MTKDERLLDLARKSKLYHKHWDNIHDRLWDEHSDELRFMFDSAETLVESNRDMALALIYYIAHSLGYEDFAGNKVDRYANIDMVHLVQEAYAWGQAEKLVDAEIAVDKLIDDIGI